MSNDKILIIDDELKALSLLKVDLEALGYEVLTASEGAVGMVLAIKEHPDFIILDIKLPDISGWEVCKILKSISLTSNIPILFITAFSSQNDVEKAKVLGACEYITKPINPAKLHRTLQETLSVNG